MNYKEGLKKSTLDYEDILVEDIFLSPQEGYDGAKRLLNRAFPDAIVAASAIVNNLPLITADKGFNQIEELNLKLIVPAM